MPRGVFRYVIFVGGFAVKLPRMRNFTQGLCSNRWEREMWRRWRPVFQWQTLCPIYAADPLGLLVVMPRASQPVSQEELQSLPDYYPDITAEAKPEDYGRVSDAVVALDYGLPDKEMVLQRRKYYEERAHAAAIEIPR